MIELLPIASNTHNSTSNDREFDAFKNPPTAASVLQSQLLSHNQNLTAAELCECSHHVTELIIVARLV